MGCLKQSRILWGGASYSKLSNKLKNSINIYLSRPNGFWVND